MSVVGPAARSVSCWLGLFLTIAGGAFASGGSTLAAEASRTLLPSTSVRLTQTSACHRVEEVNASLFPNRVIGYDFAGAEAGRVSQALRALVADDAPDAALVRVVLDLVTYETIAFQFGHDGCHAMTIRLEFDEMMQVFERAGITAPFGPTYSRIDRAI